MKLRIYKATIKSTFLYGSETKRTNEWENRSNRKEALKRAPRKQNEDRRKNRLR